MDFGTKRRIALCAMAAAGCVALACGAGEPTGFVNDVSVPSTLWMLSDAQNDVFVQPLIKRWRPYNDFVRFEMNAKWGKFQRRLSHVATLDKPVDGAKMEISLVNGDEFETVKKVTTTIRVGKKGVGEKDVYAQILGDSFTHGRFFVDALVDSGHVPKLHLVGLLKFADGQYNEGRGGWTLGSYFNVPKKPISAYHGYMQPAEGRYWGARAFWTNAWQCVRHTQPKGFEPTYSCSRYDDCVGRFDEKTGTLLNPQPGDVQFDNAAGAMVRWDGAAWKTVDEKSLKFGFDYAKYLDMWGVKPPQFLFVLLGLNDFRGNVKADFTTWGEQIKIVKESYLKACPNGKFVICIPCSTCGSIDNAAGDFTPRQNAAMWRFRDWLVKNFDRRESEGYYLLDAGVSTDNELGYGFAKKGPLTLPYEKYKGEEQLRVQTGNPHPYPNYPAMGLPFAAFIQHFRD